MAEQSPWEEDLQCDDFARHFRARRELAQASTKEVVRRQRDELAHALLAVGARLIPSEHLRDHEFVVSVGVYEMAKKIIS